MSVFKIYDCDFGLTVRGVNYSFPHVENMQIEDPERTRLIRGGNAGDKLGIVYKDGIKEAKTVTLTILSIDKAMHDLLKSVFDSRERIDGFCVSRTDGSSKMVKNAVLSQEPKQLNVDDTAESMNLALVLESFDISEVHKS